MRTAHGWVVGRWIEADAELGFALLRIPLGDQVGCATLANRLPIVRDLLAAYTGYRQMMPTRVHGFRLRETPRRIVTDPAKAGRSAAVFDSTGALVGFRIGGSADVVLHDVLGAAMGLKWQDGISADLRPVEFLDDPGPELSAPTTTLRTSQLEEFGVGLEVSQVR